MKYSHSPRALGNRKSHEIWKGENIFTFIASLTVSKCPSVVDLSIPVVPSLKGILVHMDIFEAKFGVRKEEVVNQTRNWNFETDVPLPID